jgi:hypothetical protein
MVWTTLTNAPLLVRSFAQAGRIGANVARVVARPILLRLHAPLSRGDLRPTAVLRYWRDLQPLTPAPVNPPSPASCYANRTHPICTETPNLHRKTAALAQKQAPMNATMQPTVETASSFETFRPAGCTLAVAWLPGARQGHGAHQPDEIGQDDPRLALVRPPPDRRSASRYPRHPVFPQRSIAHALSGCVLRPPVRVPLAGRTSRLQSRRSCSNCSDRPILNDQAGNLAEIARVACQQRQSLTQRNRCNPQIHRGDSHTFC